MAVMVECRDDCRILQMLLRDGCGAFQNLDRGKRVAAEWATLTQSLS